MDEAFRHIWACQQLLERETISAARAYCVRQRVLPPLLEQACGKVSAPSKQLAAAKLRDYGWWAKQIKLRDARDKRRQSKLP